MSATKDLLPFPQHDTLRTPVARQQAPAFVTRPLVGQPNAAGRTPVTGRAQVVRPAKAADAAVDLQLSAGAPICRNQRGLRQPSQPEARGRRAGTAFAQARFARAVELTGSCLLIVTFLAAALFV